ncbi:MAG: oligosaccharide flippase family protein [Candidatus Wildermuthbacteria bacterium]|nr:oligosaccharide flippase family protein [Candidatus Wildermuthbacteria bacterium]
MQSEPISSLRQEIVKHIAQFSFGTLIKGIGQFVNQYVAALLLGPAIFGVWQGARLLLGYGTNVGLGTIEGMQKEIPVLRGRGNQEKVLTIARTSFFFNFAATLFLSIVILLSSFFIHAGQEMILALRFISVLLVLQFLKMFYETWLKAHKKFDTLSVVAAIDGIGFLASLTLIFFYSFLGFLLGYVFTMLASTAYAMGKSEYKFALGLDGKTLRSLMIIGFPIMLIGFSGMGFQTIDRVLILGFLGAASLGEYSLGWLLFMPFTFLIYTVNSVMFPHFAERFGAKGTDGALLNFIVVPIQYVALIMPTLIGAIVIALPELVPLFLPAYEKGVLAAQIFLFGSFFISTVGMAGNFFISTNRQNFYLLILAASFALNFVLSIFFLSLGLGIVGVAWGAALSYFFFFIAMIVLSLRYCGALRNEIMNRVGKFLFPVLYSILLSILVMVFIKTDKNAQGATAAMQTILARESIFFLFSSYLVYLFLKNMKSSLPRFSWKK